MWKNFYLTVSAALLSLGLGIFAILGVHPASSWLVNLPWSSIIIGFIGVICYFMILDICYFKLVMQDKGSIWKRWIDFIVNIGWLLWENYNKVAIFVICLIFLTFIHFGLGEFEQGLSKQYNDAMKYKTQKQVFDKQIKQIELDRELLKAENKILRDKNGELQNKINFANSQANSLHQTVKELLPNGAKKDF